MNIRTLKLYHCPASRSARVKWMLLELKLTFERHA